MERSLIDYLDEINTNNTNEKSDWKESIQEMLNAVIKENNLPDQSLHLMANYGRDGNSITSYSVCIYEPDYPPSKDTPDDPTRNSTIVNIKEAKDKLRLMVDETMFGDLVEPEGAEIKRLKSDPSNIHVIFSNDSSTLGSYVKAIVEYTLADYTPRAATFGCCSKYEECSDAKQCIHENKLYSKACYYRANLEAGRIFYGKNRNVE